MGLLDKILGRGGAPAAEAGPGPFDCDAVKAELVRLTDALGALADAMDTDGAPMTNPGWSGRVRDLRGSRADLRLLSGRGTFERDDLFEVLVGVRPLYRGTPPAAFAHLAALNDEVRAAIEAVHAAAR
ncbi:MAG: hypothetical protein IPJ61_10705 [Tessaracoccus sp.]|uniref:hypothetical protein n=1 Tax=Tessaracoccus sp. TaxID=1971211 RepID=UPI001EC853A0|nr:hypothetical protein [Tessaracoccus sp.]MBK7821516.1 hypothetical protein [Tessaracoccus sp.]